MKLYSLAGSLVLLGTLVGCAPTMQASVPQDTANIGGMESTPNNPIERNAFTASPPKESASKTIAY